MLGTLGTTMCVYMSKCNQVSLVHLKPRSNELKILLSNAQHACSVKSSVRLTTCSVLLSRAQSCSALLSLVWWRSKMLSGVTEHFFCSRCCWALLSKCSVRLTTPLNFVQLAHAQLGHSNPGFECFSPLLYRLIVDIFLVRSDIQFY